MAEKALELMVTYAAVLVAIVIIVTGLNDVIASAVPRYEPLYLYLAAVALVAGLVHLVCVAAAILWARSHQLFESYAWMDVPRRDYFQVGSRDGRLWLHDGKDGTSRTITLKRRPGCRCTMTKPAYRDAHGELPPEGAPVAGGPGRLLRTGRPRLLGPRPMTGTTRAVPC